MNAKCPWCEQPLPDDPFGDYCDEECEENYYLWR